MIYTLNYLREQAKGIQAAWNGKDDSFSFEGESYTEDSVHAAKSLEETLDLLEELIHELDI